MKKYFLLLMASACISVADAQLIKQNEEQKKQVNIKLFFFLIAIILSGTIVIEPVADLKLHAPYFEEDDIVKKNNFFVKTENGYELYMKPRWQV